MSGNPLYRGTRAGSGTRRTRRGKKHEKAGATALSFTIAIRWVGLWWRMRTLRLPDPFPRGRPGKKLEIGTSAWAADSCLVEWSNLEREWLEPKPSGERALSSWAVLLGNLAWKLQSLLVDLVMRALVHLFLSLLAGASAAFVTAVLLAFAGLLFPGEGYGFLASETSWSAYDVHLSIGDMVLIATSLLAAAGTWRLLGRRR
jgi:hypothetical protein